MRRKEFLCEREGYCEVVQRGEGIRIHPALHRRGCIRAFLGHPGERLPLAERRRDRRVRSAERPEGLPGGQRRTRRIKFLQPVRKPSQKCGEGFLFGEESCLGVVSEFVLFSLRFWMFTEWVLYSEYCPPPHFPQRYDFTGLTPNNYMDMDLSPIFGLNSHFGAVLGRIRALPHRVPSRSLNSLGYQRVTGDCGFSNFLKTALRLCRSEVIVARAEVRVCASGHG